jgi:putative membrane protein
LSKTDEKQWRRTSPLAAIFYLGKIYKAIAQNAVQSLAPLVAVLFASKGDLMGRIVFGVIAFVLITLIGAIIRYWFFRYRIEDDSILIREGVLKKTQLDIKFDRIQAINTQQNIIFRQFGLVTVQLDTAGSAQQEGHLPAINSSLANALKERIRSQRPAANFDDDDETALSVESRPLLKLGNKDMVRIGLSSNRALVFLVLLGPLIENLENRIGEAIDESTVIAALDGAGIPLATGAGLAMSLTVLFLLFLAAASVVGAFLRYHNFELCAESDVIRSTGGLLTRHEHSVKLAKIQSLRAIQNPVLRLFGRFRLRAKQASSGKPGKGKQFIIPVCEGQQLPLIAGEVFGDEFANIDLQPKSASFRPIAINYVRSRLILFGLLPSLLAVFLYYFLIGMAAMIFLIWIPLSAIVIWTKYRKFGFAIAERGIVLRRGFIGYQTTAFLYRKVQRISVTQTLLQERKNLATIRFFLASGSLRLPYVDVRMARDLRDYILFRVESSQRAWH